MSKAQRAVLIVLALLLAMSGDSWGQSRSSPQPNNQSQAAQQPTAADQRGTEQSPAFVKIIPSPKTAAETTQDAEDREEKAKADLWIIRWTGAVAVFTLVLAGISGWQGIQLKRSVDLLAQSERAQMFIVIHSEHLRMLTDTAERYVESPDMGESVLYSDVADVSYSFKNYGKTPAIVREISGRLVYGKRPPDEPTFVPTDQVLQEHMIASGEATAVISPLDDVRPHRCKMDEELTVPEVAAIVRAQSYIWFCGRILYDDIFGRKHEHRFLWRFGGAHNFRPNYEHPKYVKNS
jgi:hypothetical protein